MPLTFPNNPSINQIFQPSGSAASYRWTGTFWQIRQSANPLFGANQSGSILQIDAAGYPVASTVVIQNGALAATASFATSASFATTASFARSASFATTASYSVSSSWALSSSFATTSSFATSASFATTASYIAPTYGRTALANGTTVSIGANTSNTVMEFTIPSAGVWEVHYNVRTRSISSTTYGTIFLTDTANTQVSGSTSLLTTYFFASSGQKQATNGAGQVLDVYVNQVPTGTMELQSNTAGMDFIVAPSATTYRVRCTSYIGTTQALSDTVGQTVVWFRRIG